MSSITSCSKRPEAPSSNQFSGHCLVIICPKPKQIHLCYFSLAPCFIRAIPNFLSSHKTPENSIFEIQILSPRPHSALQIWLYCWICRACFFVLTFVWSLFGHHINQKKPPASGTNQEAGGSHYAQERVRPGSLILHLREQAPPPAF